MQGVFFRASAKDIAERYMISGWIRNTTDDKVEAIVTGNEPDVERFIEWCKDGPEKAVVMQVEIIDEPLQVFERFNILR